MPDLGLDPCPACEGNGGMSERDGDEFVWVTCEACNGEGVVERDMSDFEYEKRRDERDDHA